MQAIHNEIKTTAEFGAMGASGWSVDFKCICLFLVCYILRWHASFSHLKREDKKQLPHRTIFSGCCGPILIRQSIEF